MRPQTITAKQVQSISDLKNLRPVMRNDTRWSSTFEMLLRYFELKDFLDHTDPDLAVHIPSASEELEDFDELKKFDSVSRVLQAKDSNKLQSRVLFSQAKYFLNQYRKKMLPMHLKFQLFLMINEHFWDVNLINKLV